MQLLGRSLERRIVGQLEDTPLLLQRSSYLLVGRLGSTAPHKSPIYRPMLLVLGQPDPRYDPVRLGELVDMSRDLGAYSKVPESVDQLQ